MSRTGLGSLGVITLLIVNEVVLEAALAFDRDFEKNGSIASIKQVKRAGRPY